MSITIFIKFCFFDNRLTESITIFSIGYLTKSQFCEYDGTEFQWGGGILPPPHCINYSSDSSISSGVELKSDSKYFKFHFKLYPDLFCLVQACF